MSGWFSHQLEWEGSTISAWFRPDMHARQPHVDAAALGEPTYTPTASELEECDQDMAQAARLQRLAAIRRKERLERQAMTRHTAGTVHGSTR